MTLRVPKLFDLRGDPFERADHESANYDMWRFDRVYLILPAVDYVSKHLSTYVKYPPRKLQSESYTGPITITQYQRFQYIRDQLEKDGFSLSLPTGN